MKQFYLLLVGILLVGCTALPHASGVSGSARSTFLVVQPAALSSDLAHLVGGAVPPRDAAALAQWETPVTAWMELESTFVAREWVSAPRAARCYALIAVALNDTLQAVQLAQGSGIVISEDAALAASARNVMSYLHPMLSDLIEEKADTAQWIGVWRGTEDAAAVARGQRIGERVAAQIRTWAATDGAEIFSAFVDPAPAPGVWQRTPPRLWSALDPGWGRVRPMVLPDVLTFRAEPPPAWNSDAFRAERASFVARQQHLTDAERDRTRYWAAGMGSVTPAGMWLMTATGLLRQHGATNRQAAQVYATLATSMHDSFIACWDSKYQYLVVRPITWMREDYPNWVGTIETPPFPSYPSGHAMVSGTASTILSAYFPDATPTLKAMAEEAAWSRVTGGIHWKLDSDAGSAAGRKIATWILTNSAVQVVPLAPTAPSGLAD